MLIIIITINNHKRSMPSRKVQKKPVAASTDLSVTADLHLAVLVPLVVKVVGCHEGDVSSASGHDRFNTEAIAPFNTFNTEGTRR